MGKTGPNARQTLLCDSRICYFVLPSNSGVRPSVTNQRIRKARRRDRNQNRAMMAIGVVLLVVGLAILVDSALYYNKVHAGVGVNGEPGISLAGLTRDEAVAALTHYVKEVQNSPIVVKRGNRSWSILPTEVGTKIDVEGAVLAAMDVSRRSTFVVDLMRRFKLYFSGEDIPLRGTVDSALLDRVLRDIAQELDLPPVDAGITLKDGRVTVVDGQKGRVVDRETLREQLKDYTLPCV